MTRWASVAFGAGVGLGSAYTDCSRLFDSPAESLGASFVSDVPVSQVIFFFLTVSLNSYLLIELPFGLFVAMLELGILHLTYMNYKLKFFCFY